MVVGSQVEALQLIDFGFKGRHSNKEPRHVAIATLFFCSLFVKLCNARILRRCEAIPLRLLALLHFEGWCCTLNWRNYQPPALLKLQLIDLLENATALLL